METVILVIHLILASALVIVVLLQRSEGAGLMGSSGSAMMPLRGSANVLTRATAILAALFMATSLTLAVMAGGHSRGSSIADQIATQPAGAEAPATPAEPVVPTAPLSK